MVRKVRKIDIDRISQRIALLRKTADNFIAVSNAEWYSLFKDEIRNSIAIEGVFANRHDLIDVLEHNKRTDHQKAAAILGYFDAASAMYEYAYNQFQEKEFILRLADIKQIHTMLMRYEREAGTYIGEIGDFRKTNIEVARATFRPVDVYNVRPAMELFIRWFNENLKKGSYDPITLASMAHVWFETIHPFRDGNGRSGRILLSYILVGSGFINIAIKGVSSRERNVYYDCLERADAPFEKIHRRLERHDRPAVGELRKIIQEKDFSFLRNMVVGLVDESIRRLEQKKPGSLDPQALLPLRDVGRIYGYSQDYLRNLINRGRLRAERRGKLWYVRVRDIASYAAALKKSSAKE